MTIYSKKLMDKYNNPTMAGRLPEDSQDVGTGLFGAPACGDVMKLQIRVNDENVITDAKFKTFGCKSAIGSSQLACEELKGKTLDEAENITNSVIAEELELPPVKLHCSVLAAGAIKAAVNNYKSKNK